MLWRRDMLDEAGGIRALASELAEDAAATKVVRRAGLRVRLVDAPFEQPLGYRSAAEMWRRQVRWARLRRTSFKTYFMPEILAGGAWPLLAVGIRGRAIRSAARQHSGRGRALVRQRSGCWRGRRAGT